MNSCFFCEDLRMKFKVSRLLLGLIVQQHGIPKLMELEQKVSMGKKFIVRQTKKARLRYNYRVKDERES